MTVEIKITGADAEDAVAKLVSLAGAVQGGTLAAAPQPAPVNAPAPAQENAAEEPEDEPAGFRAYGQSEPGKARRTKAQMAEDEQIDELAAKLGVDIPANRPAEEVLAKLIEAASAADEPQISSNPEDRRDPAEEIEDAEEVEDEAPTATREDVRNALAAYAEKFGLPTANMNAMKLLGAPRLSAIPDDPAAFQAAVDRITAAIEAD